MKRPILVVLVAMCCSCFLINGFAQDDATDSNRKVVNRVVPYYPAVARNMGIGGNVRVEVLVSPDGSVRSLQVKGGHPMLAQAAADAVRRWKWVPATHETKEPVVVKFEP